MQQPRRTPGTQPDHPPRSTRGRGTPSSSPKGRTARDTYFFAGVHYPRLSRAPSRNSKEAKRKARYCFAKLSYAARFFTLAETRYDGDFIPAVTLEQLAEAMKEVKGGCWPLGLR